MKPTEERVLGALTSGPLCIDCLTSQVGGAVTDALNTLKATVRVIWTGGAFCRRCARRATLVSIVQ